ncbi:hypothetical protein RJ639_012867 [Escallonia herrerae]|uniref:RNase H type-1 domain-containing protein n=1 Tax=Escallonia herrerae TaxID=1293975 RepID=A0AA88VLU1_9ASTE|nr:hypothetical protein RJ639_012867 [Escallonia herrerae]
MGARLDELVRAHGRLLEGRGGTELDGRGGAVLGGCKGQPVTPGHGVSKDINAIGLGVVVRDITGCFIAEALAALDGIKLAQQLECQRLCIEGDAVDIISALKSRETNLSKIGHIVDEIKKLADSFQKVQILHVKRTRNNVAHSFAKEGLFIHDMRYWRDVVPDFVVPILLKDVPA